MHTSDINHETSQKLQEFNRNVAGIQLFYSSIFRNFGGEENEDYIDDVVPANKTNLNSIMSGITYKTPLSVIEQLRSVFTKNKSSNSYRTGDMMSWLSKKSKPLQDALKYHHNRPLTTQEVTQEFKDMMKNRRVTHQHLNNILNMLQS
jgi:hypothetical protein